MISDTDIEVVTVGSYNLPNDVITKKEDVLGKFAAVDLKKGDYLLPSKVTSVSDSADDVFRTLDGTKQAISVTIQSFAGGLSGKLENGDIVQLAVYDARENFDENKIYLDERIEDEPNGKIRELLMRDKAFLDDIQVQMSTSREFLIAYRLRNESDEQSFSVLNRVEKCINEQGFNCNRCEKDDVKRILARHCGIKTDDTPIADTDGEETVSKWIIPD